VRLLYLFSVWLHIVAAIVWIGGMAFLVLVVVPWLRGGGRAQAGSLLRDAGRRFRTIGWVCLGLLAATGAFNLSMRGVGLASFTDSAWLASDFGRTVVVKLALFALMVALSAVHDFFIGPRATDAIARDPRSPAAVRWRLAASWLGRINALLALLTVWVAVAIVRGLP
jgi:putative copper export protein